MAGSAKSGGSGCAAWTGETSAAFAGSDVLTIVASTIGAGLATVAPESIALSGDTALPARYDTAEKTTIITVATNSRLATWRRPSTISNSVDSGSAAVRSGAVLISAVRNSGVRMLSITLIYRLGSLA